MEFRKMVMITLYAKQKKRHRCTEQTFGLCGRRWGWDISREQHEHYLGWNRSPAQVGCMRQVPGPGALGRPRGIGWRGRWEGGLGWGIHVTPWLIHVSVLQNPLQYCEMVGLQLIKINEKKNKKSNKNITLEKANSGQGNVWMTQTLTVEDTFLSRWPSPKKSPSCIIPINLSLSEISMVLISITISYANPECHINGSIQNVLFRVCLILVSICQKFLSMLLWASAIHFFILLSNIPLYGASLIAQLVKNPPATQETSVQFLGQEELLKKA